VFHTQQAVEKAMKGFLACHGRVYRKTHNLVEIGEACAAIDPTLEPLLRRAAELTEYAWRFRYPGNPEEPTEEEARGALPLTREVFDSPLHRLPPDVRL
jgi:HEPN domain-containing protein